ncbi:MAG: outer membrane lipoprotein-sorting protein [Pseudomonadota bacterium]
MTEQPGLQRLFEALTAAPKLILSIGLVLFALAAAGLAKLEKDTSIDAFVPPGHSSLLANDLVTEQFGLTEPIAVAVFAASGQSVFEPSAMRLIENLSEALSQVPNIRADRIANIAMESSIRADADAISVETYRADDGGDAAFYTLSRQRWQAMPPHVNTLVSANEQGAVIMAELIDPKQSAATYEAVQAVVDAIDPTLASTYEILVAGPAAVSGYLSSYINRDARMLQPMVFGVVLVFLYLAFLRAKVLLAPMVVLLGAVGGAMGVMAWNGIPYFAITNALPVILVAIAVADAIHILSAYFTQRSMHPERPVRQLVIDAMLTMARPITLTTVTTMAGFIGIAVTSIMPPITYFAAYATLGVLLAWAFSLFVLPSALMLLQPKASPLFRSWRHARPDPIGEALTAISLASARRPGPVIGAFLALTALALYAATDLRVDRSQVENFRPTEPIRIADERIHEQFAGTAFLDTVVSTDAPDGLLNAAYVQKIADLQAFLEGLPHVSKTISIADYLSLLHRAVEGEGVGPGRPLPDSDAAIAQYLMVYEASGDPSDLDEEITPDYDAALIRVVLDSHLFSDSREVVEALQSYLDSSFNEPGLTGTIAGDVNVAYHWMVNLKRSHFTGVALSLGLILLMAIGLFRSFWLGVMAVVPVSFTVLIMYGVMGALGTYLEPATSMFAAISLGVGVDFAIHLLDFLKATQQQGHERIEDIVKRAVPVTARACLFNAAALGVGFAVLLVSNLPTLQRFGGLVTVAAFSSFLAALIVIPAGFALYHNHRRSVEGAARPATALVVIAGLFLLPVERAEALEGIEVAQRIADRPEATALVRTIRISLEDRRGRKRQREAVVFRRNDSEQRETRISYLTPKAVRELTFLSRDFRQSGRADLRWLYLPAARKVRRIPASDRGDYFLGTDFTFEDVQSDLKFDIEEYTFSLAEQDAASKRYRLTGVPVSKALAKALGYERFEATVDAATWFPTEVVFYAADDTLLKTIRIFDLHQIDGIWSAGAIEAEHHRNRHRTRFDYLEIKHYEDLPDSWFVANGLVEGLPNYEQATP